MFGIRFSHFRFSAGNAESSICFLMQSIEILISLHMTDLVLFVWQLSEVTIFTRPYHATMHTKQPYAAGENTGSANVTTRGL